MAGAAQQARMRRQNLVVAVILVQSAAVAVCLTFCFYLYSYISLSQQTRQVDKDIFIQLKPKDLILRGNGDMRVVGLTLDDSHEVVLTNNSEISVNCTGPYILNMKVCCKEGQMDNGTLDMWVKHHVHRVHLQVTECDCKGYFSTVYLTKGDKAVLHFYSSQDSLIKINVTLGLHYQLGRVCRY